MLRQSLKLLALATFAVLTAAAPASAGSYCCGCGYACAPAIGVVPVPAPLFTQPFLIVDQGPVYSGPGIVLLPGLVEVDTRPATYPYVGRDFAFPYWDWRYRHHHR
jgi:hypothetical protein